MRRVLPKYEYCSCYHRQNKVSEALSWFICMEIVGTSLILIRFHFSTKPTLPGIACLTLIRDVHLLPPFIGIFGCVYWESGISIKVFFIVRRRSFSSCLCNIACRVCFITFNETSVCSLPSLVTDSLTHWCFGHFIDVNLTDKDAFLKSLQKSKRYYNHQNSCQKTKYIIFHGRAFKLAKAVSHGITSL